MAGEAAVAPKLDILQAPVTPKIEPPKIAPIGPKESAMADVAARREKPDVTLAVIAGEAKPEVASPRDAARKTIEAKKLDPEQAKHLVVLTPEEQLEHAEYLASLRDPNVVGKDVYGKGVVNFHHHKGESTPDAEEAQEHALEGYQTKIDAGLVDPSMIATEMNRTLQVDGEIIDPPTSYEQVVPKIVQELQGFVDKGLIAQTEADVIKGEADNFSQLYKEGYPGADQTKVYEVTRDMTRIIAYQTRMDKNVLVGSDHGVRHILRGNMKFADQIMASLGDRVSPRDKVLVHAIITMHDIGYTTGAAQSPEGFEASKDHPVAGAAFIEANKEWVSGMFGADAVAVIQEGILDHSYVGGAFEAPRPEGSDINPKLIRAITSSVDSLGVTAETKIPSFFNNPDAIGELFKIRLAGRMSGRDKDGNFLSEEQKVRYDTIVAARKDRLRQIAASASTAEQQKAFTAAVESVNPRTADILGQFTGEVTGVKMVRHLENGQLVPEVNMKIIDELGTQMREMFGGEAELQQFVKVMEDLGITKEQMQRFNGAIESSRNQGITPSAEDLSHKSEKAIVTVGFRKEVSAEFAQMREVFNEAAGVTQKWKVAEKLRVLDPGAADFDAQIAYSIGALGVLAGHGQGDALRVALAGETGFLQGIQSSDVTVRMEAIAKVQGVLQTEIDGYFLSESAGKIAVGV